MQFFGLINVVAARQCVTAANLRQSWSRQEAEEIWSWNRIPATNFYCSDTSFYDETKVKKVSHFFRDFWSLDKRHQWRAFTTVKMRRGRSHTSSENLNQFFVFKGLKIFWRNTLSMFVLNKEHSHLKCTHKNVIFINIVFL